MSLSLKKQFEVKLALAAPAEVVGCDYEGPGKRLLIPCPEGEIIGPDFHGTIMSAGIDHQYVDSDGVTHIDAAYGFKLDDGRAVYAHVRGIRTVPDDQVETLKAGGAINPKDFYYVTTPTIEVYDESLKWMTKKVFVADCVRLPDAVLVTYYSVEQVNDHPALG